MNVRIALVFPRSDVCMSRIKVVCSIGGLHGGGSERQLIHVLTHLDRSRYEPLLYVVDSNGPLRSLIPDDVPVTAFVERVRSPKLYLPGRMHALRVRDYASFLKSVRADLSYDRTFLMTLIAAAGAQRAGVPNVSTIVTDPETGFAPVAGRFAWFKRRLLHRLYNKSTQVLAVSEGVRESAIRFYGIEPQRIATHRNGVDITRISEQAAESVADTWWTAPADRRVVRVVSAGRLNHEKGFHVLIDAIARARAQRPDWDWRVALLGEGSHRERLQSQIDAAGLRETVKLPGFVMNAPAWFSSADLFVLASLVEGSPNVLLEAMACGAAVIATDCRSGPAELLDHGRFGRLVPVENPSALAAAIVSAANEAGESRSRAAVARIEVHRQYSIERTVERLEAVFETAIK
jgi:glycosyltransferase involved in cell wall biosynthesis